MYVESLDRKKDASVDLAAHWAWDDKEKTVVNGEWDGFHSLGAGIRQVELSQCGQQPRWR